MPVLQLYYTVWNNTQRGFNGEQEKARSPGVTDEMLAFAQDDIRSGLFRYVTPPGVDVRDVPAHPVALRFRHIDPETCVLVCCRYTGPDQSLELAGGQYASTRTGNKFIHALFLSPEDFVKGAPILYWRSPFWIAADRTTTVGSLPSLPRLDIEPTLTAAQVWRFMATAGRWQTLYTLLCAVLVADVDSSPRPIVILDDTENVAQWIAAVTLLLPARHRLLLSFTTYYDTYPSPFIVTGMTPQAAIHADQDYADYFILNARSGKISRAPDSPYARWAVDCASAGRYESDVLPILHAAKWRPVPRRLNDHLDGLLVYSSAIDPRRQQLLARNEIQSLHEMLVGLASLAHPRPEDLDELARLHTAVLRAMRRGWLQEDTSDYPMAVALIHRVDVEWRSRIAEDMEAAVAELLSGREGTGAGIIACVRSVCGAQAVSALLTPELIQRALQMSGTLTPQSLLFFWRQIGPLLSPAPGLERFFATSVSAAYPTGMTHDDSIERALAGAIRDACKGREREWLVFAVRSSPSLPGALLDEFYYQLVCVNREPAYRASYRPIVQAVRPDILWYEWRRDLSAANVPEIVRSLQQLATSGSDARIGPQSLVSAVLADVRKRLAPAEWHDLSCELLLSPHRHVLLSRQWQVELLRDVVSRLSFAGISPIEERVCQLFYQEPGVPNELVTLMGGVVAMSSGRLDPTSAQRVHQQLAALDEVGYQDACERFVGRFFADDVTSTAHGQMVAACYIPRRADIFWQIYWAHFNLLFSSPQRAAFLLGLLTFWFDQAPNTLSISSYVVPSFFLGLPRALAEARKQRGFNEIVKVMVARGSAYGWLPLVMSLLPEDHGFLGLRKRTR